MILHGENDDEPDDQPRAGNKNAFSRSWILVPEINSKACRRLEMWNVFIFLLLLFAAYAIPFSVALPNVNRLCFGVFNRILDTIFILDMMIIFRTAYRVKPSIST